MGLACRRCGAEEHTRNGFMRGKQRYRCRACGLNFTDTPPRGMPLQVKVTAVLLYVSGLSMNRTAKLLGVDAVGDDLDRAVRQGSRAETGAPGSCPGHRARRDVALSKKKTNKLWIWKAWDRASGRLVDWECGGRDRATLEQLLARVTQGWNPRLYCTDDWAAYQEAIPQGRLYVGKDETHGL